MVNRIIDESTGGEDQFSPSFYPPKSTNPEPFSIQGLHILLCFYQKIKFELIDRS